jgi:hypothetical protein
MRNRIRDVRNLLLLFEKDEELCYKFYHRFMRKGENTINSRSQKNVINLINLQSCTTDIIHPNGIS